MGNIIQLNRVVGKRFGLAQDAIYRLWKAALKDDEGLIDEVIKATYDRLIRRDPIRAEQMMSLIIRRHRDGQRALRNTLIEQASRRQLASV
jgi:hypothetical protein